MDNYYFASEAHGIAHALIVLKGQQRKNALEITSFLYKNEEYAKKWYYHNLNILDRSSLDYKVYLETKKQLTELYNNMIGD